MQLLRDFGPTFRMVLRFVIQALPFGAELVGWFKRPAVSFRTESMAFDDSAFHGTSPMQLSSRGRPQEPFHEKAAPRGHLRNESQHAGEQAGMPPVGAESSRQQSPVEAGALQPVRPMKPAGAAPVAEMLIPEPAEGQRMIVPDHGGRVHDKPAAGAAPAAAQIAIFATPDRPVPIHPADRMERRGGLSDIARAHEFHLMAPGIVHQIVEHPLRNRGK